MSLIFCENEEEPIHPLMNILFSFNIIHLKLQIIIDESKIKIKTATALIIERVEPLEVITQIPWNLSVVVCKIS